MVVGSRLDVHVCECVQKSLKVHEITVRVDHEVCVCISERERERERETSVIQCIRKSSRNLQKMNWKLVTPLDNATMSAYKLLHVCVCAYTTEKAYCEDQCCYRHGIM